MPMFEGVTVPPYVPRALLHCGAGQWLGLLAVPRLRFVEQRRGRVAGVELAAEVVVEPIVEQPLLLTIRRGCLGLDGRVVAVRLALLVVSDPLGVRLGPIGLVLVVTVEPLLRVVVVAVGSLGLFAEIST